MQEGSAASVAALVRNVLSQNADSRAPRHSEAHDDPPSQPHSLQAGWAREALAVATHSSGTASRAMLHDSIRSHQVLRALSMNREIGAGAVLLLQHARRLEVAASDSADPWSAYASGRLVCESLYTLQKMIRGGGSNGSALGLLWPQLWWGVVGALHSQSPTRYCAALKVLEELLTTVDLGSADKIVLASYPDTWHDNNGSDTPSSVQGEETAGGVTWRHVACSFSGLQPLVCRGLLIPQAQKLARQVLLLLCKVSSSVLVDPAPTRAPMAVASLLPVLICRSGEAAPDVQAALGALAACCDTAERNGLREALLAGQNPIADSRENWLQRITLELCKCSGTENKEVQFCAHTLFLFREGSGR